MDEIAILRKLDHPNIVKFYETYNDYRYLYLVYEYIDGKLLFQHITTQEGQRFTEKQACHYFQQVVRAICHLHALGIMHRDIKPENLMVTKSDQIKLIDFGLGMTTDSM